MSELPPGFLPDLRAPRSYPGLEGSLWREPYLVAETHAELCRVVRDHVDAPADVLDLGCGTGYVALELARDGCRVVGVDADEESVALARRALDADPMLRGRDVLSYEVADAADWDAPSESFDVVVASRVLHHVTDMRALLAKAARWLRPGGRLVAVEFGYDLFDRRCATWLYEMRGLLQAAGAAAADDRLGDAADEGVTRIWDDWWRWHEEEHELHGFGEISAGLRASFTEEHCAWLPYLHWEVLEEVALPAEPGRAVARFLRRLEEHLIATDQLPALLFSWRGRRP